ncbi:MAG: FhaA domain-containing protein [Myxococcota bacterium]
MSVSRIAPGRFRVDFSALEQGGGLFGRLKGLLNADKPAQVDLYGIAQAVCAVMIKSTERDVDGSLLAWNEYKVYLSRIDHERIRVLQDRLQRGLESRIHQQLSTMKARTVGDPVVRVLVDEETDLPQGVGEILVAYVVNDAIAAPQDGEMTVRVNAPQVAASGSKTQRVMEPGVAASGGGLILRWAGGEARIPPGRRAQVGRPHAGAPDNFVALTGASNRINSAHFHLERGDLGMVVSRPVRSNPVKVNGKLLQPGGRLVVSGSTAEIELSNGEMSLTVEID